MRYRVRIGKRPQQDRIDDREDCGVGSDTQRQRKQGDCREARAAPQHAPREAEVVPKRFNEAQPSSVPAFLFYLLQTSEIETRSPLRFLAGHALAHILLNLPFHVKAQFIVEFAFDGPSPQQSAHSEPQIGQHHGPLLNGA